MSDPDRTGSTEARLARNEILLEKIVALLEQVVAREEQPVDIGAAARLLGCSVSGLRRAIREGRGPVHFRISDSIHSPLRFRPPDIRDFKARSSFRPTRGTEEPDFGTGGGVE